MRIDGPAHATQLGIAIVYQQLSLVDSLLVAENSFANRQPRMRRLAQQGKGILLISSELPELLLLADRILVVRDGRVSAELSRTDATEEDIMNAATT